MKMVFTGQAIMLKILNIKALLELARDIYNQSEKWFLGQFLMK